jgi:hypothetical protein
MVRPYVPTGVDASVVTFIVELPEAVTELGVKLAVAPVGSPVTLKPTEPVNPPLAVVLTV